MTPLTAALLIALVSLGLNLVLGVLVLWANPHRLANRQYLVLTLFGSLWLGALVASFASKEPATFLAWVRTASIIGCLVPIGFRMVRLAVLSGESSHWTLLKQCRWQLLAYLFLIPFCISPLYMEGVRFFPGRIPEPSEGALVFLFPLWFLIITGNEVYQLIRGLREARGLRQLELQFLLASIGILVVLGILPSMVIPLVAEDSQAVMFAPLWVLLMDAVIAYGIATKQIMEVRSVVRRLVSGLALACYLSSCYALTYWVASHLLGGATFFHDITWASLLATLVVVLTMGSAQHRLKIFLSRAFAREDRIDSLAGWRRAAAVTRVAKDRGELFQAFETILREVAGTDRAVVMEAGDSSLIETRLQRDRAPLSSHHLSRRRGGEENDAIMRELATNGWEVALGIPGKEGLRVVVYLAERLSGRLYSESDLAALDDLVRRFGNVLENASLSTEVANREIVYQTLLDNLVSGVVAFDMQGRITHRNPEAIRLLGGEGVDTLPEAFRALLGDILEKGREARNEEWELLDPDDPEISRSVRVGGAPLRDQEGVHLGALIVIHDISEERRLEKHVRQSDRLATIGKVSASVAHEIKNPLVAIRAFAQLLPERIQDKEFLSTFSNLLDGEVERINRSIGGLLSYARHEQTTLGPISLHEGIEESVRLLAAEFRKKRLEVDLDLRASPDHIMGHAGQWKQIVVNLLLNANDAMDENGHLKISTCVGSDAELGDVIEVQIQDDGKGMTASQIRKVLVPFYTTKPGGTGLGLSLTANLVSQHHGTLQFESTPNQGTTAIVRFPTRQSTASETPPRQVETSRAGL